MMYSWPLSTGPSHRRPRAAERARREALVATTGRSIALLKERRAHRRGGDGADAVSRNYAIIAVSCAISIGIQVKE